MDQSFPEPIMFMGVEWYVDLGVYGMQLKVNESTIVNYDGANFTRYSVSGHAYLELLSHLEFRSGRMIRSLRGTVDRLWEPKSEIEFKEPLVVRGSTLLWSYNGLLLAQVTKDGILYNEEAIVAPGIPWYQTKIKIGGGASI